MTLDEAIQNQEEIIQSCKEKINYVKVINKTKLGKDIINIQSEYIKECEQYIEWLQDYKKLLEKQKIGEWCPQNDDYFDWYECSECGYGSEGEMQYSSEYDVRTNYCPYCGADMRER